MNYRAKSFFVILLTLSAVVPAAAAPDRILEGRAVLIWGDPMPGSGQSPVLALSIQDANGESVLAAVEPSVVMRAGGAHRVDHQHVRVELEALRSARGTTSYRAVEVQPVLVSPVRAKAISGTSRWISLLCKFADVSDEPEDLTYFTAMYEDAPGRLDHYWQDLSYGAVTVAGSTADGWFDLPNPQSTYVPTPGSGSDADLTSIFEDCTAAADPFVDFSQFDGINLMLNELLDCCAWGGGRYTTLDGVTRSWRVSWNPPWSFANTSVVAHEMGHGFGLPHSNNSDGDTNPYDSPWDVMSSSGSYTVADGTYGSRGKHTISHHKDRLGWISAAEKLAVSSLGSQVVTIDHLALATTTNYRMAEIVTCTSRTYTVEAREPYGEYDGALPGKAVIIHEVDPERPEPAWVLDADDPPADFSDTEGVMWKLGEIFSSPDDLLQVEVLSETANGFEVRIDNAYNCPPLASPDVFGTVVDHTLNVSAPGVLTNDQDSNAGDVLTAESVSGPAQGSSFLGGDGSLTYTPNPGFLGDDEIVYQAFDGTAYSNEAAVTIKVLPPEYELETATGNLQYFYVLDSDSAIGVKFELYLPTEITSVGASLYGVEGTVFAALVPLDPGTDLPADPTLGDAVFTEVFTPESGVTKDVEIPVSIILAKGRYALILGSGLLGASGTAYLGVYDAPSGAPEYLSGDPQTPFFADWDTEDGIRFFIHGIHQAAVDCTGDETTGDADGDGICADLDCDDADAMNICQIFSDGFESGNTSAWTATVQ